MKKHFFWFYLILLPVFNSRNIFNQCYYDINIIIKYLTRMKKKKERKKERERARERRRKITTKIHQRRTTTTNQQKRWNQHTHNSVGCVARPRRRAVRTGPPLSTTTTKHGGPVWRDLLARWASSAARRQRERVTAINKLPIHHHA